ncbi:dihydrofolate reductase family protein [Leucobacter sp. USHLN153]|uniref:dihydrofolate reductase family protein n=1 Tax=Leucobacter sp. USHLN153 TaxID=3081268 RepID=UPI00301A7771
MGALRYSINVALDGCVHHEAGLAPDAESMRYWTAQIAEADALLFGRVTYEMMAAAWRRPESGGWPDWMEEWETPFAEAIDGASKHVVSRMLGSVDWNAELLRGELGDAVRQLKERSSGYLSLGGVKLPTELAALGLIDEFEFLVQPVVVGHGPRLLEGLRERIQLELVERREFASGAVLHRYRPAAAGGPPLLGAG